MDDLKELLVISNLKETEIPDRFKKIAEDLMCNHIIKKGQKEYAIIEIEFYLYSQSHRDYITYPREIEAGRWFFHQSGVDLTFKTEGKPQEGIDDKGNKYLIYKDCSFGGILIRGLYQLDNGIPEEKRYIFGPQKCVNELWDNFDAFKNISNEYPYLELASKIEKNFQVIDPIPYKRHIKLGKDKTIKIKEKEWAERIGVKLSEKEAAEKVSENFNIEKEESSRVDILEAKYRFFNIIDGENTWNEIKHLTNTEKKDLKKLIQG